MQMLVFIAEPDIQQDLTKARIGYNSRRVLLAIGGVLIAAVAFPIVSVAYILDLIYRFERKFSVFDPRF